MAFVKNLLPDNWQYLLKVLDECGENCRLLEAAGYTIGQLSYVLDS